MFKLMTVRGNNYKKKKTNTVTVILAPDIPTYPVLQSFQILLKISRSVELTHKNVSLDGQTLGSLLHAANLFGQGIKKKKRKRKISMKANVLQIQLYIFSFSIF